MITFDRDRVRFTLRVAGIAIHDGRVLLHRGPTDDSSFFDRGDEFIGDEGGSPLYFRWHRLDNLDSLSLYPTFLKHHLHELPDGVEHIIHFDDK